MSGCHRGLLGELKKGSLVEICAYCKIYKNPLLQNGDGSYRINGEWIQSPLPSEFSNYRNFTHGICPYCLKIVKEQVKKLKA